MDKTFKVELGDGKQLETYTIGTAVSMIESGDLVLTPKYQTGERWKEPQKAKLMDSIVSGLDLPKLYFRMVRSGADDRYEVVDGQQRLRAISAFLKDDFKLREGEHKGKPFSKLPMGVRKRVQEFALHVIVLNGERWTDEVIHDLFLRLQMGTPLNPAEKRRALPGNFPIIVAKLSSHKLFGSNTSISENRYGYEDAVAKILHLVLTKESPKISDGSIRKTYLNNKDILETSAKVAAVKKAFDYLAKALRDSGEYFKKFNILSVVEALVEIAEEHSLSDKHGEVGNLLWDIENRRKANDALGTNDPARDAVLTMLSETARSDRTDHLIWRKSYYAEQLLSLGFPILDRQRRFTNVEKGVLMRRQSGRCVGDKCGGAKITAATAQVDHIKPYSRGGLTILGNAQLLCEKCNKSKGNRE